MWVGLGKGGGGQSHTQLDGFKTRVLRAGVSEQQRHLYMTAWRSVSTSTVPPMAVLVLTQRASLLPHQSVAQQRTATPLPAVVMATALQQHTMEVHVLCALEVAVSLTQAQAANCQLLAVHLLTLGAQLPRTGLASSRHAGSWGLARSVRAEAQLPVVCIDASLEVALERLPAPVEPEAVMRLEGQLVSRLVVARGIPPPTITSAVGISGTHLVTGGTGGLGMLTARWLGQAGASALALASRGGALVRHGRGRARPTAGGGGSTARAHGHMALGWRARGWPASKPDSSITHLGVCAQGARSGSPASCCRHGATVHVCALLICGSAAWRRRPVQLQRCQLGSRCSCVMAVRQWPCLCERAVGCVGPGWDGIARSSQ
jgi:hypothetical protein